jgi:hypothetical protein
MGRCRRLYFGRDGGNFDLGCRISDLLNRDEGRMGRCRRHPFGRDGGNFDLGCRILDFGMEMPPTSYLIVGRWTIDW